MFERRPPREITELIEFPPCDDYTFDQVKFYNKTVERAEKMREKYKKQQPKIITYKIGELVLLKNRELPSTIGGIAKKCLLLYTGPYTIVKDNQNNTYEIMDTHTNRTKGVYNQASLKKYNLPE